MTSETGNGWTMHLGDCLDVMATFERVDHVITDPPYGVGLGGTAGAGGGHGLALAAYESHDDSPEAFGVVADRIRASIALAGTAAVFMSGASVCRLPPPDALGGVYLPAGCGRSRWGFVSFAPVLFYGSAPGLNRGAKPTVCVSTERAEESEHPVPKPLGWMLWLVGLASSPGNVVLDPFAGSGTTGVACLRLGRTFIGIEKDPKYFALACDRLRAEEGGSTLQAQRAGQVPMFGAAK